MIVAIDFDGTLVEHDYPRIGAEVPHAVRVCKRLNAAGCQLILWTMRSAGELEDAAAWCTRNGIAL